MSVKVELNDLGHVMLVIEGYGGLFDAAGDVANFKIDVGIDGPEAAYKLARDLIEAANKLRERPGFDHNPGPYTILPAVKRDAKDLLEAARRKIEREVADGNPRGYLKADRMRVWTLDVPDDPEARGVWGRTIGISNDGSFVFQAQHPVALEFTAGVGRLESFMMHPITVPAGSTVMFFARPLQR